MKLFEGVKYPLYSPSQINLPLLFYNVQIKYVEMLDQECVILPHQHNDGYEIYHCLEGELTIHAADMTGPLNAGDILLITPSTEHYTIYRPDTPCRFVSFHFSLSRRTNGASQQQCESSEAQVFDRLLQLTEPGMFFLFSDQCCCKTVLLRMDHEMRNRMSGWEMLMRSYFQEYLICVIRSLFAHLNESLEPEPEPWSLMRTNLNIPILLTKFMRENYSRNIQLQDLSDRFYLTPRQIQRVFSKYFNSNFKQTLNSYRIVHCKYCLENTDEPLEQIAENVGFSSAQMLIRAFKASEGVTPSQYRHNMREKGGLSTKTPPVPPTKDN